MLTPFSEAVQFVIILQPDGRLQINGPLDNKLLCYGMLDMAKDVVRLHNVAKVSPAVPADVMSLVKGS